MVSSSGVSRVLPGCVKASSPALARNVMAQRGWSIHQTVPTSSFDAVLQRRHHALRPDVSFHPRPVAGFCTLCGPCGHWRRFRLLPSRHCASIFLPTFPRHGFAIRAFRGCSPLRYYAGSDSCRASPARQVSPFHLLAVWASRPQPRRAPERHVPVTSCVRSVPCGPRLRHLWAGSPQHAAESGSSSCGLSIRLRLLSTPTRSDANTRPSATQLPSATYAMTSHGMDSHHADKTD